MTIEREQNGDFAKGNKGGPGRPKKERELRYYEIMQSKCTFSEWGDICQKAVDQAKLGDTTARIWLSNYLIGQPVQKLEHGGMDGKDITLKVIYDK